MSTATQSLRPLMDRLRRQWRASPLPGFFGWWGGELRDLLPSRWRDWLGRGADWHVLEHVDAHWILRRAGRVEPLARWSDQDDAREQQIAFTAALQQVDREDLRVALLLSGASALQRTLSLPLAARANLEQVVGFEMDRQTPFQIAQVYYGVRELAVPAPAGRLQVELVAVTRSALDPLLASLRASGIAIDAVDLAEGAGRLGVNLLPSGQRPRHTRPRLRLNLMLALASVLLLFLVLAQWLHNREAALAQMQAEVESMRGDAQQVAALRTQLQDNAGAAGFLAQRKKNTVPMLSLLREATLRLPESAWLERLSVDNTGQIGLQGQATQAAKLLDALKDSPLITHAGFQGSIQPDPTTGKERFYLNAQMPQPKAAAAPPAGATSTSGGGAP